VRNHLVGHLVARGKADERFVFMTGDLGFGVVEPLEALGPRFVNAGIAEANMVSMAASLAASGLRPWCYSIVPFMTVRCIEQIRNDVCYERRAVHLVGIGGGYSYGTLGPTHHALEDASMLAAIPHLTIASPSTLAELDVLFGLLVEHDEAVYWRIDREDGPRVDGGGFGLGDVVRYRDGRDVVFVTSGSILANVLAAADQLAAEGIHATVLSVPCLAPFPVDSLVEHLDGRPVVSVFEGFEGNPLEVGVLSAAVRSRTAGVFTANAGRSFARSVGSTEHLRTRVGLDATTLARRARDLLSPA